MDCKELDDFQGARSRFDVVVIGRSWATARTKRERRVRKGLRPTNEVDFSRNVQHGNKERGALLLFLTNAAQTLLKDEFWNGDLFRGALKRHAQPRADFRFRVVADEIADDQRTLVEFDEAGSIGKLVLEAVP